MLKLWQVLRGSASIILPSVRAEQMGFDHRLSTIAVAMVASRVLGADIDRIIVVE